MKGANSLIYKIKAWKVSNMTDKYEDGKQAVDYKDMAPGDVRALIRSGVITGQTSGMCDGYAQANLVVLPRDLAFDFLLFCTRNPKPCPILEVGDVGSKQFKTMASEGDVCKDFPKYRIWRNGVLEKEVTDITDYWQDDFVYFLIGCSFSFESELLEADVPVRHIQEKRCAWQHGRHGNGVSENLYLLHRHAFEMVYRECAMGHTHLYSTRRCQFIGMNLRFHTPFVGSLQDACRLCRSEESFIAEHVNKIGKFLLAHLRYHLVDHQVYIVRLRHSPAHGMCAEEGGLHAQR